MKTDSYRPRCFVHGAVILAALCTLVRTVPVDADPVFRGIGSLPGGLIPHSRANAVSADGTTIVGASSSVFSALEAFRWTIEDGIVGLGDLPGGDFWSEAFDVSADGSLIVGLSDSTPDLGREAFRWEGGTMTGLGDLPGGTFSSSVNAVSADGAVLVGEGYRESGWEAFRWTSEDGLVGLGDFSGGELHSDARDVSADGSVIVGRGTTEVGSEAFRWTPSTGMVGLGHLPGGYDSSSASAVSPDGTVIVGSSVSEAGRQAYRWTQETGMVALGHFIPVAMSHDTSTIVGLERENGGPRAIIWDAANGLRGLHELLEVDLGLDLTGWTLKEARDVSADGTVIVGVGVNPSGYKEGWVAVIPEPSTLILAAFAACIIGLRRSRNSRWLSVRHEPDGVIPGPQVGTCSDKALVS